MDTDTHYVVRWEIDIFADSPEEAAQRALETQRIPGSTAVVFQVVDADAGQSWHDATEHDLMEG